MTEETIRHNPQTSSTTTTFDSLSVPRRIAIVASVFHPFSDLKRSYLQESIITSFERQDG
jgi:hypothetical protein